MSAVVMVVGMSERDRARHAARLSAASGARLVTIATSDADASVAIGRALEVDLDLIVDVPASVEPTHLVAMAADAVHDASAIECIVDARTMLQLIGATGSAPCSCGRAQQLLEQLEQSTVATIVGWHPLSTPDLSMLMALISHVAPRARLRLERGAVEPPHAARLRRAHDHAGWTCVLNGDHDPHMTDPRVSALRVEELRPFHPARLRRAIDVLGAGRHGVIVRSAGFVQLATRPGSTAFWDQAAGSLSMHPMAPDEGDEPLSFGQDLAVIGIDLDHAGLRALLAEATLDDAELAAGSEAWARYPDPFPAWHRG